MDAARERKKILARTGYLSSEVSFYPGMRVKDILKLSAGLRGRDCRKTASLLCEWRQLDTARKAEEFSFGNRRKIVIVCALQHETELLILDEPTSRLDPLMQREFFEILRERNRAGTTIFLSSHILSEIQHNCSKAAMIRDGTIIAGGSMAELSRTGAKRISIRGAADPGRLTGVKELHRTPETVDFLYSGDIQKLLRTLAAGDIRDITITEPDLEEVFLHYYGKGEHGT